jgi:hypothetical protein
MEKRKPATGPLSKEELDELARGMLRNLADPNVREQVDAAEARAEKKMREA